MLTATTLRTLPLWLLGSDDVKQRIAEASEERSGATEYARGLRALTGRDYLRAAAHLRRVGAARTQGADVRAAAVYALCLAGMTRHRDDARARRRRPQDRRGTAFLDVDGDTLRLGQ